MSIRKNPFVHMSRMFSMRMIHRPFVVMMCLMFLARGFLEASQPTTPTPAEMEHLVQQLTSPKFKERDAAYKRLTEIGEPALAALRRVLKTGDKETQRRAVELLVTIEARVASAEAVNSTKVHVKASNTPLAAVLRDLSKQSKIRLYIAHEPPHLGDRAISLDTGHTSFWQALDEVCRQAKVHLRPEFQSSGGVVKVMGNAGTVHRLVLEDGAAPEMPTAYIGAVRVSLLPRAFINKEDDPKGRWVVEVLSEPKLRWQEVFSVLWDEALGRNGKRLVGIPSMDVPKDQDENDKPVRSFIVRPEPAGFDGRDGGAAAGFQNVRRMEIPLKWDLPAESGFEEATLRGRFKGAVQVYGVAAHVDDVKKNHGGDVILVRKGVKLTVEKFQKKESGEVILDVLVDRDENDDEDAAPVNSQNKGDAARNGGFHVWDDKDRPYKVKAILDLMNGGKAIYQLILTPPAKNSVPMRLELHGPYVISVEQPFVLRRICPR